MAKQNIIATAELAEIIADAIREENYFTKDVLIPKIRTLIRMFRLDIAAKTYSNIENPTKTQRLIRSNELHNLEKEFWKQELKKILKEDNMTEYYTKLDIERKKWQNQELPEHK